MESDDCEIKKAPGPVPTFVFVIILTTAFILIDAGVSELIKLVAEFALKVKLGEPSALLNLFLIPVGVGLIHRRTKHRGCALWVTGAICLLGIILGVSFVSKTVTDEVGFDLYSGSVLATMILFTGISWWSLKRYRGYFDAELSEPMRVQNRSLVWVFVFVSAMAQVDEIATFEDSESELSKVFYLNTEIYGYDENTRKPLSQISFHGGSSYQNHPKSEVWTGSTDISIIGDLKISGLRQTGISIGDYRLGVGSEGYETKEVVLNKDSPRELLVYLKPVAEENSNGE